MKKTILGIIVCVCVVVLGVVLTGNVQYSLYSKEHDKYVVPPSISLSPSPLEIISANDINEIEYGKMVRIRGRLAFSSSCISPWEQGFTLEKQAQCIREKEQSLCVGLFESNYIYTYDTRKIGFDPKLAVESKFVVNPRSLPNFKPSWIDGNAEVIVIGKRISIRKSEDIMKSCYIGSGDLFVIHNVEEPQS